MRMVVKFGGTSIKTTSRMRSAARNVCRLVLAGHQVMVVVSAMGDATNRLILRGREVCPEAPFDQHFLSLLSTGEGQSASLMAMALAAQGCKSQAIGFDHPRFPLVAAAGQASKQRLSRGKVNDPVDVRVDEDESCERFRSLVEPLLNQGVVPVFPGFFIREREQGLVTLGRGGSDVSAFLVGRFSRSDEVVIVTDVKGVLTADPRVVAGTSVVAEMDAGLLTAISHAGAQVLHPNALRYKPESCTARVVHFRELGKLAKASRGTLITGAARTELNLWPEALNLILLFGTGLAGRVGVLARLGGFLAERGVSIHAMTSSDTMVALYIESASGARVVDDLHREFVGAGRAFTEIISTGPVAELTLYNRAFIDAPGVIQAIADSLSRARINIVEMVTSHANIVVYCRSDDGERAREILAARLGVRTQRPQPSAVARTDGVMA